MLTPEQIKKFAKECKLFCRLENRFIERTGRALTDEEAKELCWQAELIIWGPAGCGHCKPGYGCNRHVS